MKAALPLLLGVLAVGLSGCKALLYVPEPHVIPLFDAPGQVQAAADVGLDALGVRVAGTPLPHVFLFGGGSLAGGGRYEHRYAEAGAGLYIDLGRNATVEVLAGAGGGRAEGDGNRLIGHNTIGFPLYDDYRYEAASRRSFIQLNLGRRLRGGAIHVAAALRLARVRFGDLAFDGFETAPPELPEEYRGTFVEPGWLFRARLSTHFDLDVQGGYSFAIGQEHWELFRRRGSYASGGIRLYLGR